MNEIDGPVIRTSKIALSDSERLKQRFRELGVAYIEGAEGMTEEELNSAAASLLRWRDERLAGGAPLLPANVCVTCFLPHRGGEEECRS
jgi:hypothetical protein